MIQFFIIILQSLQQNCLVFYTGGNNIIPLTIYSNFLSGFNNMDIYRLSNKYNHKQIDDVYSVLNYKYKNVIIAGHSSGCSKAINNCNNAVNKLILFDPVKTPFLDYTNNLNHLDNILIINAEKSYKWSYIPPFIPFIPLFRLYKTHINIDIKKIKEITVNNYGHCDIIDNPYRNIMHYARISVGHPRRGKKYIKAYYRLLHNLIRDYINIVPQYIESNGR